MDTIECACGATYERSTIKVPFRDQDSFECQVCRTTLEKWSGSRIPKFKLISSPDVNQRAKSIVEMVTMDEAERAAAMKKLAAKKAPEKKT